MPTGQERRARARAGVAALAFALGACSTNVLHGLDERSANEAEAALERAGVAAEKVVDDSAAVTGTSAAFTVRVARADGARALDLLRAAGLPRDRRRGFAEAYGQPSLIPTASEERARYLDALAGEIERTLETVDGVIGARVHLVPADTDPAALEGDDAKTRPAARAAVLLKTRPESARPGRPPIDPGDVRRLVAGSVPGLAEAAVAVVTTEAPAPTAPGTALAAVGPLRVTAGSRPLLVATLAGGLALLALLAVLLLVTARRLAAMERVAVAPAQRKT